MALVQCELLAALQTLNVVSCLKTITFLPRYTMAPEVLKGRYSKNADLWSIGVIAYMLMSSQMPFYGRSRKQIIEQILRGCVC
jgi:serine/threonine protein kinase